MSKKSYRKIFIPGWAIETKHYQKIVDSVEILKECEVASFGYFKEQIAKRQFKLDLNNPAQQINDYVDNDSTIVFCHSLGSIYTLQAALLNENIKAVIVFSGFAKFAEDVKCWEFGQNVRALRAMKMMLRKNAKGLIENFYKNCATPKSNNFVIPENFDKKLLQEGLEQLIELDIRENLTKIRVPVIFIHGDEDQICRCEVARDSQKIIDNSVNSEFHSISGTGHNLLFDSIEKWQKIVQDFVEKI
ncbi:alpha/beta hydrolase [Lentisphaerota bacterium WC36G]|nr:alpha/beta hydrolase [Lentisphaerae bacterium WC36]